MKIKNLILPQMLRAFNSRNYRLFFIGQGISLIGNWITQIATIWLVYQLTESPLFLGLVGFASQIPNFILAPFGGIFVDKWNRHRILLVTQFLSMLQSFGLAFLALTGMIEIWHLIILSIFQGLINSFDMPGRQSFVIDMVENKEDLANAIALNSALFNSARLIGPAIAGLLIAAVGSGVCFLIDGISYLAVIYSLLAMKIKIKPAVITTTSNTWERLKEGFVYAFSFPPIRATIILLALMSCLGMSYIVLVPVFATKTLHGSSNILGFLMSASGVGALLGSIYLSSRKTVLGLGKYIAISPAIWGFGLIIFALSRTLWLSLLMMFVVGFASIMQTASSNTFLQTIVEDDKRGRVMSIYIMAFIGSVPIGNLLVGVLADKIGVSYTLIIAGTGCILASIIFTLQLPYLKSLVRPIYSKMGLISENKV